MSKSEVVRLRVSPDTKQRWQDEAERRGIDLSPMIELAVDQFCDGGIRVQSAMKATEVVTSLQPSFASGKRTYEPDFRPTYKAKTGRK